MAIEIAAEDFWAQCCYACRLNIVKELGFSPIYAKYRWRDFQPHSRVDLAELIFSKYLTDVVDGQCGLSS